MEERVIFGNTDLETYPHGGRKRGGGTTRSPLERLTSQIVSVKVSSQGDEDFPYGEMIPRRF